MSERAFSGEENDIFHWFWTFSKHCSLSPGCCPLSGGTSGAFHVYIVFALGVHLETGCLRLIVDEILAVGASLRTNKSESQVETLWAVLFER